MEYINLRNKFSKKLLNKYKKVSILINEYDNKYLTNINKIITTRGGALTNITIDTTNDTTLKSSLNEFNTNNIKYKINPYEVIKIDSTDGSVDMATAESVLSNMDDIITSLTNELNVSKSILMFISKFIKDKIEKNEQEIDKLGKELAESKKLGTTSATSVAQLENEKNELIKENENYKKLFKSFADFYNKTSEKIQETSSEAIQSMINLNIIP
jgi:hypothetical protein